MPKDRKADDWTPEVIRRFWDWQARQPSQEKHFFSKQVGRALANILWLSGGLKGRVLDFGCGTGFLLERLCQRSDVKCEGVDLSPKSIEAAVQRLSRYPAFAGATTISGAATPHLDATFDCISCIETIEHLKDNQLEGLIGEIHRLLKPGGTAMFTTPCNEDIGTALSYCPFCDSQFHHMQHLRSFSPEGLRAFLESQNFEVVLCVGLDLWAFQKPKGLKLINYSIADVFKRGWRILSRSASALIDKLSPHEFPNNRRFRQDVKPGPHLVAIARKPKV